MFGGINSGSSHTECIFLPNKVPTRILNPSTIIIKIVRSLSLSSFQSDLVICCFIYVSTFHDLVSYRY
uniref:Uncharacterized protein n=1 Tax=uncultured marine virus TaxID=186617 RepID=A0A0F7L7K2_9VIRU|nr:hypothetical protein [uncultured marine virus]